MYIVTKEPSKEQIKNIKRDFADPVIQKRQLKIFSDTKKWLEKKVENPEEALEDLNSCIDKFCDILNIENAKQNVQYLLDNLEQVKEHDSEFFQWCKSEGLDKYMYRLKK